MKIKCAIRSSATFVLHKFYNSINVDVLGTSPQKVRKTWPGSFQMHSSVFIAATTHLAIPICNRKNPYLTTNVTKLVERFPFYRYQSTINEEINGK